MIEMMSKLKTANREMEDQLGRLPTIDELSAYMKMSHEEAEDHPQGGESL